ncbi:hypothetical protein ACFQZE_03030 [Paenibacillus sp. GCM10027627]|uniref:hypothetical protein n=1 Tax=unclassified Paenibacillus TaxID=185978 RepID=UPI00362A86E5
MKSLYGKRFPLLIAAFIAVLSLLGAPLHTSASTFDAKPSPAEHAAGPIQVFEIAAGKVVKAMPNDEQFQKMATEMAASVTGLAPQLTADRSCTYVYRIPLARDAVLTTGNHSVTANELFLFYCKEEPPLLLAFDNGHKPYLFLFNADIAPFLKKVGLP